MGKKFGIVALIIALVAVVLSCVAIYIANSSKKVSDDDIQYVMYLGTNDKDTNNPSFNEEESLNRAEAILTKHFSGFTIQDARGGWTNDDGSIAHEYTLVIILSDTTQDKIHTAAAELQKEFNQSSVMIKEIIGPTEFYSVDKSSK